MLRGGGTKKMLKCFREEIIRRPGVGTAVKWERGKGKGDEPPRVRLHFLGITGRIEDSCVTSLTLT